MINAASPVTGKAMTREEVVQKIRDFSALLDFMHAEESEAAGLPSSSPFDVESAAMRIGYCADHAGLIALAAEGLEADGDNINGPKFRAAAEALGERLAALRDDLDDIANAWRQERIAAKWFPARARLRALAAG